MKDERRTYDFCADADRPKSGARIPELMLDGWSAYSRWLLELEKAICGEQRAERRRTPR